MTLPLLTHVSPPVLVACPCCSGWPFRLQPGMASWCLRCRRWVKLADSPDPEPAPPPARPTTLLQQLLAAVEVQRRSAHDAFR